MDSIDFVTLILVGSSRLRYLAGYLLLPAPTAWFLIFTSEMTLGTGFAGLDHSCVARNFAPLPLVGGLCVVVCYMSLEQVSAAC